MIYVALPGQFDNVGDTVHRRVLLDFLRPLGALRLYIGDAPSSFLSGLELDGSEELYTSVREWALSAYQSADAETILTFAPGEIRLGGRRAARELVLGVLTRRVRRRGGRVMRLGIAAGNRWRFESRFSEFVVRSAVAASDVVAWRERRSQQLFGTGTLLPDLAFGVRGEGVWNEGSTRRRLAVTLRFDRPFPPRQWLEGVRAFASDRGLEIVVGSQVRRDNARAVELAELLRGSADPWPTDRNHREQEEHLRKLYRECALVVSDRLHALIVGATEGAAVSDFTTTGSEKVPVHFETIGAAVTGPRGDASVVEVQSHLENSLEQQNEQSEAVRNAYELLSLEFRAIARM